MNGIPLSVLALNGGGGGSLWWNTQNSYCKTTSKTDINNFIFHCCLCIINPT
jgi:hypothetical protein